MYIFHYVLGNGCSLLGQLRKLPLPPPLPLALQLQAHAMQQIDKNRSSRLLLSSPRHKPNYSCVCRVTELSCRLSYGCIEPYLSTNK